MDVITLPKVLVQDVYICGLCQTNYGTRKDLAENCCTMDSMKKELTRLHALYDGQPVVPDYVTNRIVYLLRRIASLLSKEN